MLNATGSKVLRGVARQLEGDPLECLVDWCHAAPDPDGPVDLCVDHGYEVFRSYLGRATERPASIADVRTERSANGTVYFVRKGEAVKIGWSSNAKRRMYSIQPDAILHTQPGTKQDEAMLHAAFAHLLIEGRGREWFRPEPDLMSFILRLKTDAA